MLLNKEESSTIFDLTWDWTPVFRVMGEHSTN